MTSSRLASTQQLSVSCSRDRRRLFRVLPAAVFGTIMSSSVAAAGFSFVGGGFADNSRADFGFGLNSPSAVTLQTWSYAGGTNYAGEAIPSGGFDPIVSVFTADGQLLADNDDGSSVVDPSTGLSYDSLLSLDLSEGQYQVVLTEFPNRSEGTIDAFTGTGGKSIARGDRTGLWALDILGVDTASGLGLIYPADPDTPVDPEDPTPVQETINTALQEISVNSNTSSTASVISTSCPQATPGSQFSNDCTVVVLGALSGDAATNAQAAAALVAVTDEQATVPLSSSQASISSQLQNVSTRLAALRAGATGLSLGGLAINVDAEGQDGFSFPFAGQLQPTGGAASADAGSLLAGERLGAFINGTISSANKDATSRVDGFENSSWSITAGIDYRFLDNLIAGLAVGYYKSQTDIDNNGGDLDTDGYSLSLYGTYYQGENLYLDGIVTYGNLDYDQDRNIRYQIGNVGVNQTASASYGGEQWSAALGGGYNLASGPWTYGPVARLEYLSADVDSYRESISNPNAAGGAWAASLDGMNQESFTSMLGGEVSRAVSTDWGVVMPKLHLGWIHEFRDDAVAVNGAFIADPTNGAFSITADRPDSDYFNARLSVSTQFAGGSSAFLFYNKVLGYRDLDVDTIGAGLRMVF